MTAQSTWQLGSAAVLLAALAAGFWWYERSRPPARVVAAVAVLASFAVIGRILFAPFPNVKPTTDIVIIAGFAMGAEPGLLVGALAALVSNFYFAQGPWTPWQMFAWALCGLFGALLARLSQGRLGRIPFALCCAVAGLAYGVILNFGSAVNFGGSDLWTGFVVYSGQALPFDIAHAVGNFAFFMLAGPALIAMLRRLRRRTDVVWPAVVDPAISDQQVGFLAPERT
ncbi:MAG: ECF transporter S component [Actinobacteria bacterium]|nr:ECF transporter S component [Actinomycetota bacterium]